MKSEKHALFLQVTEPGGYPPLVNATAELVAQDWQVTVLGAPIAGRVMRMPSHPRVQQVQIAERPSHVVSKLTFLRYGMRALALALRLRPTLVYASDPTAALFGLLASRVSGATLVYHEHDSPNPDAPLNRVFRQSRARALRSADLVVFPNAERGQKSLAALGIPLDRLRVIWNVPRRIEIPPRSRQLLSGTPLILYYHGSINEERLPLTIAHALLALNGQVVLDIVGYEAPGAQGSLQRFLAAATTADGTPLARYQGEHPERADILAIAARADVGLAFMPMRSADLNMAAMVGASNKAFDYMAAGLALLFSDLSDWMETFAQPGYGWPCNPEDPASLVSRLQYLLDHRHVLAEISQRNREKIANDWNYDTAFAPLIAEINRMGGR